VSLQSSLRRRRVSGQSVRRSQPVPWIDGLGLTALAFNNVGSSATASATANTAGSWLQLFSNTAVAAGDTIQLFQIFGTGNNQVSGTDNSMLLDIGKGASGSEVLVAQDIAIGGLQNSGGFGPALHIPVRIEGATRIAIRVRAATASRVFTTTQIIISGAPSIVPFADRLPTSLDTMGTSTATSAGTAMTGASGTWTEITASTTKDFQALVLVPSGPGSAGAGQTAYTYRLDLGIGPAGGEVPVASAYGNTSAAAFVANSLFASSNSIYGGFVPAGTRISVRHNLAASPGFLCACVIGVPYV
jgi:hypothetical protein